jgi:hypothetical protein
VLGDSALYVNILKTFFNTHQTTMKDIKENLSQNAVTKPKNKRQKFKAPHDDFPLLYIFYSNARHVFSLFLSMPVILSCPDPYPLHSHSSSGFCRGIILPCTGADSSLLSQGLLLDRRY